MWVIYQKSDRKVVGLSADVDTDPGKDQALQEVVKGLAGSPDPSLFDAFQVKERGKGHQLAQSIARGQVKVQDAKSGGGALEVADNEPDVTALVVTTNAKDFHPVDKVPLLAGDGQSFLVVTVQKTDDQGKALTRKTRDNDTIWLRTTNGTLREDASAQGGGGGKGGGAASAATAAATVAATVAADTSLPREIRSIQLTAGTATFRVYSENARRLATVTLLPTDPNQRGATVQVELT